MRVTGRVRVVLVLAAVAVSLFVAASASGNFPQSINQTIPSGGEAWATSSTLPPTATSATITVTPSSPADNSFFGGLTTILAATPSRSTRLLTCLTLYSFVQSYFGGMEDEELSDPSLQLLLLRACLTIAFNLPQTQHGALAASQAATACPRKSFAVGMRVTSSGGQYHVHVKGTTRRAGRSPLVVACRRLSAGMQITLRARASGRPLTQVVGPTLGIGFLNRPGGRPVHLSTTFSVR